MSEELKSVAPFTDHKPEKLGRDGKILRTEHFCCHIVNGAKYFNFPPKSDKFYNIHGEPIPLADVPEVCKKHIKKVEVKADVKVDVKPEVKNYKKGSTPDSGDSVI